MTDFALHRTPTASARSVHHSSCSPGRCARLSFQLIQIERTPLVSPFISYCSGTTSFRHLMAFKVLGYPTYGNNWVTTLSNTSFVFPRFLLPWICPFNCDSQPPRDRSMENVRSSLVLRSMPVLVT